jgi:sugar lactone lactonase YvrE
MHELTVAAESTTMIWNGVAVDRERVFVSGPRWAGADAPAVARIDASGALVPYPDAAWNAWKEGDDPGAAFVNVNALHRDHARGLWIVDTGTPQFGGDALAGGTKIVHVDLDSDAIVRVYALGPEVVRPGTYVDDIRTRGRIGYLTDAGNAGLIVLDLETGAARRVLDGHPATIAPPDRPIVVDHDTVYGPDGSLVRVQSDPLELSPDGRWLCFGPLEGPWSRIETRFLDDPSLSDAERGTHVEPWADLPPIGGSAMDGDGSLYFTDMAACAVKRRAADGTITTLVRDPQLHWVDAPYIDEAHTIWLPTPQLDRVALFHHGTSQVQWPIRLYRMRLD